MNIAGMNLFDRNAGKACRQVRPRCTCISLILIYLINMWVWNVPKLDSDVHQKSLVLLYLIKNVGNVYGSCDLL